MKLFLVAVLGFCVAAGKRPIPPGQHGCDYKCDSLYDIVCAVDMNDYAQSAKLFPNYCMMQTFNCLNDGRFKEVALPNCLDPFGPDTGSSHVGSSLS